MRKRLLIVVLGLVVAVLVLAACGEDDEPGRINRVFRIGMLVPLTGPSAVIGNPLVGGAQVWVDALNAEKGGVPGQYKVELVLRDSRNDAATAVQAYDELKSDVIMFYVFGNTVLKAVLPQLERDRGVALDTTLDAGLIREPNLIPVGVPLQIEAINILDYYLRTEAEQRGRDPHRVHPPHAAPQSRD